MGLSGGLATNGTQGGQVSASVVSDVSQTIAAAGASRTIPDPTVLGNAVRSYYTLTAACTFTLPADPAANLAKSFDVWLIQDGTGGRVPTFTGAKWAGKAGPPTFSVAAGAIDRVIGDPLPGGGWMLTPILNIG